MSLCIQFGKCDTVNCLQHLAQQKKNQKSISDFPWLASRTKKNQPIYNVPLPMPVCVCVCVYVAFKR